MIGYGLTQYPTGPAGDDDPIAAVRAGWDAHVRYGLANPTFYVLVHGRIRAGVPCAVVVPAQPALESLFAEAARRGLLRVPVTDAAARVLAANIGRHAEPDRAARGRAGSAAVQRGPRGRPDVDPCRVNRRREPRPSGRRGKPDPDLPADGRRGRPFPGRRLRSQSQGPTCRPRETGSTRDAISQPPVRGMRRKIASQPLVRRSTQEVASQSLVGLPQEVVSQPAARGVTGEFAFRSPDGWPTRETELLPLGGWPTREAVPEPPRREPAP